jgi:hypothetical protein
VSTITKNIAFTFSGLLGAGQIVDCAIPFAFTMPSNAAGSPFFVGVGSTEVAVFELSTIVGGTTTLLGSLIVDGPDVTASLTAVDAPTDTVLRLLCPSPQDATLANICFTFVVAATL